MAEINGNGNPLNKPGLYKNKESGTEIVLSDTPGIGSPIIDGFIQAGYVYVGPAPEKTPEVVKK